MDVDECIAEYNKLSAAVFAQPSGDRAPQFDSARLKNAILKIIASCGFPPDASAGWAWVEDPALRCRETSL
jgi:hypothetical protein